MAFISVSSIPSSHVTYFLKIGSHLAVSRVTSGVARFFKRGFPRKTITSSVSGYYLLVNYIMFCIYTGAVLVFFGL